MCIVNVHNEWDPLEEIIVGTANYAAMPEHDLGFKAMQKSTQDLFARLKSGKISQKIINETEEDIEIFTQTLRELGIVVKQPSAIEYTNRFKTLDWEAEHFFCYCPRDILLAIDNMIIETPNVLRSRYFETFSYKKIFIEYLQKGVKWIATPKPRLLDDIYNLNDPNQSALHNNEPVFDAANILRAGKDIFYLVSDSGNELGLQWLQAFLGDQYTVHPCRNLYSSMHIDTTIVLLRPGLALINPERVNKENLPSILHSWDIIKAPEMIEYAYSDAGNFSTKWLGMNLLMVTPELAIVDAHQKPLIKLLAKHKIECIPLKLRHGRTLGGGFHCITLDVRRKSKLESYF